MLTFLPILISGMKPSCLGGSTRNGRMGAIAGIGPDGGGDCSVFSSDAYSELDELVPLLVMTVAVFNAFTSVSERMPFSFSIKTKRSRNWAAGPDARLLTSFTLRMPLVISKRNRGSATLMDSAVGAAGGAAVLSVVRLLSPGVLLSFPDAWAVMGRSNTVRATARMQVGVRIMIQPPALYDLQIRLQDFRNCCHSAFL